MKCEGIDIESGRERAGSGEKLVSFLRRWRRKNGE